MNPIFSLLFAIPLCGIVAAPSHALAAGVLDGTTFVADAGPKGKTADEKDDVLTFRDGLFHSSTCDQYGYTSAPYSARNEPGAISFEAETRSDKDGRLVWRGTVRGADIEGTMLRYKKGFFGTSDKPEEMWFKGKVRS